MNGVVPNQTGTEDGRVTAGVAYSHAILHPRVSGNPVPDRREYRYIYGMAPMWAVLTLNRAGEPENRCG